MLTAAVHGDDLRSARPDKPAAGIEFHIDALTHRAGRSAGYRLYDIYAIAQLELVRMLRGLDASLDDIRRLLAERTTLRELATAHLELVERQLGQLRARRAVLRTIVNQPTTTEQVSLMTKLVSMSDDERDRLVDEFWTEVADGLDAHPGFVEKLRRIRPKLPPEPSTEQLEAWIELANLVQDADFRHAVRSYFHDIYSSSTARAATHPARMEQIRKYREIRLEARAAHQAGVPANSPQARQIADRLVAAMAPLTGEPDSEARARMLALDHDDAARRPVAVRFRELLGRYGALVATINQVPPAADPAATAKDQAWLKTALSTPHHGPDPHDPHPHDPHPHEP